MSQVVKTDCLVVETGNVSSNLSRAYKHVALNYSDITKPAVEEITEGANVATTAEFHT